MRRAKVSVHTSIPVPAPREEVIRDLLAELRVVSRMRDHLVRARVALINHIKSVERRVDDPVVAGLATLPLRDGLAVIDFALRCRRPRKGEVTSLSRQMTNIMKQLPIFQWAKEQPGIGGRHMLGLGQVLAELGDPWNYATKERVWKRMGVACLPDGTRQRRIAGLSKEQVLFVGYSEKRRAKVSGVGSSLLKGKHPKYRAIYDRRKKAFADRARSKMHAHRDAQRVMEKTFLEDLWREWRRATRHKTRRSIELVPAKPRPNEALTVAGSDTQNPLCPGGDTRPADSLGERLGI